MSESLRNKTVNGVSWSIIDTFAGQGITFLIGIVLARLLSPNEYGIIGIITIFISIFNAIVDGGFSNALIRKNDIKEEDYSTCFYTNLSVSIVLYIYLFLCAPFIADFFAIPALTQLLRVMGIIVIINALSLVQRTIYVKKIDFKTQTKASITSSVISGIVGISMAYYGCSVWSLVGQQISRQLFFSLILFYFDRWIPSTSFNLQSFIYLWSFGWKLLVSTMLNTLWNQLYQVVIGKIYSPHLLGLYTRSQQFASLFSDNISGVVQRVTYPVLSSIQEDPERLKNGYRRIIKITMLLTFTLMMGLCVTSKSFILILLGKEWIGCVRILQIICFSYMLYPLHSLNLNILQVSGRSDVFLKLEILKKLVGTPTILVGVFIDIYTMLIVGIFSGLFCYYLNAHYSGKFVGYSFVEQIKDIIPDFAIALAMAIPVYLLNFLPLTVYILFPIQVIVGVIIVISICELTKIQEYLELKTIIIPALNKTFKR